MKRTLILIIIAFSLPIAVAQGESDTFSRIDATRYDTNTQDSISTTYSRTTPEKKLLIVSPDFKILKSYYCAEHHLYFDQNYQDSACFSMIQPGCCSVGNPPVPVAGGYSCRFTENYPPDSACPPGSMIHRYTSVKYSCISAQNISQVSCMPGFDLTNQWSDAPETSTDPNWANGFACQHPDAVNGLDPNICGVSGALRIGSNGPWHCCVFLETE